ncbi:MAG: ATP-dependent metalloprotease, partial [Gammaproteobacteria bacterium]|nr:ATP-dependent metalloprotease [Gammaproteobacteria bacterium]
MNDILKNTILWITIGLIFLSAFSGIGPGPRQPKLLSFDEFLQHVKDKDVLDAEFDQNIIHGTLQDHTEYSTVIPPISSQLLQTLMEKNVKIVAKRPEQPSLLLNIFISWFPVILLIAAYYFLMRNLQGGLSGKGGAFSFGKSRARMMEENQIKVTFADVAGVDEAKAEVQE